MKFSLQGVAIESLAYAQPPEVVTSETIEARLAPLYERLKLPNGRLELMTGIQERRFWPEGSLPSEAAAAAGERALAGSTFPREEIDAVIHCGVCRDRLEPATASNVHAKLGLGGHCQSFDLSNACLGMLNGFVVAAGFIQSRMARSVLLVTGENGRPLLEHTLRTLLEGEWTRKTVKPFFANLTIGGGAAAAVLCPSSCAGQGAIELGHAAARSDSAAHQLCQGDASGGELNMLTDSEALLTAGVEIARKTWGDFAEQSGWEQSTPDRVICHQVGRRHQRALFEALGLDLAKDVSSYPHWGNVGSVSLPLTLAQAVESGALVSGQKAALLGIGSGLVCMMLEASLR